MKKTFQADGFSAVLVVIAAAALLAGGVLLYRQQIKTAKPATNNSSYSNQPAQKNASASAKPAIKGMILSAQTTKALDPKTGQGLNPTTVFSARDPEIFVALSVDKPKKGTKFEYVRYLNGKYVDHKSITMVKDGSQYASFSWKLKNAQALHPAGDYTVKLYTGGNFEKEISYQVR